MSLHAYIAQQEIDRRAEVVRRADAGRLRTIDTGDLPLRGCAP
jgi:hypothetical protein